MAATESTMMALGTTAPDFTLPDTEGRLVKRDDLRGRPLLVMFICNHCPFVKHVAGQLKKIGDDYADKLSVVAIMSNDVANYPDDAPAKMKQEKANRGYNFPYLYDATQEVAKAYGAACTPDFFLFDADHKLAYRGQLDDSRPGRISSGNYDFQTNPATGADLRKAIDAVLAGRKPSNRQLPSMGCNIKWKAGNAPSYYK
ncbi:MAG: thioredoxin family protein [Phycisphaeraceae bacterium]|nr:thioredoxin family protein [Phycisphaeraceae bacterium]